MIRFLVSPRLRARWRKLCLCSKEEAKDKRKKNWLGRLYNKVISRKENVFRALFVGVVLQRSRSARATTSLCNVGRSASHVVTRLRRKPHGTYYGRGCRAVRAVDDRRQAARRLETRPECDSLWLPLKTRVVASAVGADGRGARSHFFVRPRRCLVRPVSTGRASRMQYDHRVPAVFHAGLASVVPSCYLLCCVETERDIFSIHDVMSHKLSPPPVSIIKVSI